MAREGTHVDIAWQCDRGAKVGGDGCGFSRKGEGEKGVGLAPGRYQASVYPSE